MVNLANYTTAWRQLIILGHQSQPQTDGLAAQESSRHLTQGIQLDTKTHEDLTPTIAIDRMLAATSTSCFGTLEEVVGLPSKATLTP